jgi:hypothetical protein
MAGAWREGSNGFLQLQVRNRTIHKKLQKYVTRSQIASTAKVELSSKNDVFK